MCLYVVYVGHWNVETVFGMSTEHGRQWWSTTPVVLRRYRSWQAFLGCNPATVAVAACLGENHGTTKFWKWSEFINVTLKICKSDSLPGLYPSNASTSSGKVTAAYNHVTPTVNQQRIAVHCRAAVSGGCGHVCSSFNIDFRLEPCLHDAGCFGLLVRVIFGQKVWMCTCVDSLTFFDTICLKKSVWSGVLYLADLGRIQ